MGLVASMTHPMIEAIGGGEFGACLIFAEIVYRSTKACIYNLF